jgi:PAS domain S-box-containing protein
MAHTLQDLIDVHQFQMLQDRLNEIYSFPSAIIDNEGRILTASAWQDVCTKFHRMNDECKKECIKSDQYISDHLAEAHPTVTYQCPHGLVDNATPIIIDGVHYGNFFTGQFFLEPPDLEFFRSQAKKFNFDESAYLDAIQKVPIWTHAQMQSYLFFIQGLIEVISGIGLKNLKEAEARRQIKESEELHRSIIRTALDGFCMVDLDGRILEVNESFCSMTGYTMQELSTMRIADVEANENAEATAAQIQRIIADGDHRFESKHRRKDGGIIDVGVSVQYLPNDGGRIVAFVQDITERKKVGLALAESENELKKTQALTHIGNWHLDLVTNKVIWSEELYKMYGFDPNSPPPILNESNSLFTPESWKLLSTSIAKTADTGIPYELELKTLTTDGRHGWMWARGEAVLDKDGSIVALWGATQDITERKQAEEALRESEEKFSRTFANAPVILSLSDLETGRFTEVNAEAMRVSGFSREELIGKTSAEIGWIGPDDRRRLVAILREHGRVSDLELALHAKGGRIVWCLYHGEVVTIAGRQQLLSTSQDISARKLAEQALAESAERLEFAMSGTNDGIWDVNMETGEVFISARGCEILGYLPDELHKIVEQWDEIVHPEDLPLTNAAMKAYLEGRASVFVVEQRLKTASGGVTWILTRGKAVSRDASGRPLRMVGTHTDISDRKDAEVKIRRMEERLRQSEKMDAIGQLAGGIAHDFNNVLGGIIGYTDISLGYAEEGSLLEKNLRNVLKAADRAKNLVKQILAFSRQSNPQKKITLVRPIIEEVLELLKSSIPSSVIIEADLREDSKPVFADSTQLHQALLNLATNAVHAMHRKGKLTIRLSTTVLDTAEHSQSGDIPAGEYTVIEISDTGCGMDSATLAKAFEPFFTTKAIGEGTGMGLSVVLGIVQSHGGDIQVESAPHQGTTMRVLLPVSGETEEQQDDVLAAIRMEGTERILFIDDEILLVDMVESVLTQLGYSFIGMTNSVNALEYVRNNEDAIDMIVTDQTMPGITGIEFAREAQKIRKNLPIILCTRYSNDVTAEEATIAGISKFVMKPYKPSDLVMLIREVFENT